MCGIIGYTPINPTTETKPAFEALFRESMIRGTHAFGIATADAVEKSFDWKTIPALFDPTKPTIAHARYCQSGDWRILENNQPLVVGNMALAMNGVIHQGTKEEYETAFNVKCTVDNDSEVFLQRLAQGQLAQTFIAEITGSFAATWLANGKLWAGRNARRPLWLCTAFGGLWFASTEDIFRRAGFTGMTALQPNKVVCA